MRDVGDLTGKTMLITGANAGIGRAGAEELARRGAHVVLASRDLDRGRDALEQVRHRSGSDAVELIELDLADLDSVQRCATEMLERFDRLDVLVANAGLVLSQRRETVQGFEMTFGVNHLGHFLLTHLLLDRLKACAPARIVVTSSHAHRYAFGGIDFADLDRLHGYRGDRVYSQSKLANLMFTRELAERLTGSGVTANAFHPGSVRSEFGRAGDLRGPQQWLLALGRPVLVSPRRGAVPLVHLAAAAAVEGVTGAYYTAGYVPLVQRTPSRAARDRTAALELWERSEKLLTQAGYWPPRLQPT